MGSNLGYFLIILGILFTVGIVSSNIIGIFTDTSIINTDTYLGTSSMYSFMVYESQTDFFHWLGGDTYFSILGFDIGVPAINILALLGEDGQDLITNSIVSLSYFPDIISIPFLIMLFLTFIIFIIKLFLP